MIFHKALAVVLAAGSVAAITDVTAMEKKALTLEAAKMVAAGVTAEAKRLNAPGGVIAIVDDGGHPIYLERLDDTFPAGANIAIGKARTAATFRRPILPSGSPGSSTTPEGSFPTAGSSA